MRNKFLLAMLVVSMVAFMGCQADVVEALEDFVYDKEKVVLEVEVSMEDKTIDDVNVLDLGLGRISGSLTSVTSDVTLNLALAKLGYEINESAVPYLLLGTANLSLDQDLYGSINDRGRTMGTSLLRTEYRETSLAYGVGLQGDLLQYKGVVLGYDARWVHTDGEETDESIELVPDIISGLSTGNKLEVEYDEITATALLSKEIDMQEKKLTIKKPDEEGNGGIVLAVKSVTPYVGYRASFINMNVKNDVSYECISVANESNYRGFSNNALLGTKIQVNDDIHIKTALVIGDDFGSGVSVGYRF